MHRCVYVVLASSIFPINLQEGFEERECIMEDPRKQIGFMKQLHLCVHATKIFGCSRVNDYKIKFKDLSQYLKAKLVQKLTDMDVATFRMAHVKVQPWV